MKKIMTYYNCENQKIVILESIEDEKILFINMDENTIINVLTLMDEMIYDTLSFINETINLEDYFEIDESIKKSFIEYIEDEELEYLLEELKVVSLLLKD